jgi:AmpE protein
MTFIAILVALIVERFFHWGHLRHWQWFARYQRFLGTRLAGWPKYLVLSACVIPPALIVAVINCAISNWWYHLPKLIFDIVILIYCLGPKNLWVQIYSCIRSLNKDETHAAIEQVKTAFGLTSIEQPQAFHQAFTRAIFIEANQRIFAVLFWFVFLGPLGAILYRTISLCAENTTVVFADAALQAQRLLDWLPARLFTLVFALGGNFSKAFVTWKQHAADGLGSSDILLGECGIAALDVSQTELIPEDGSAENEALSMLDRVFVIGLVSLALIVLLI